MEWLLAISVELILCTTRQWIALKMLPVLSVVRRDCCIFDAPLFKMMGVVGALVLLLLG